MLRAVPKNWFSSNYRVLENNNEVATIDLSWWREAGTFHIKGAIYNVYRERLMSGAFIFESGGAIIARAEKPSALYRSFVVEYENKKYQLEAESAFFRKFILSEAESGQPIGEVYPESALTRKAVVDLPEAIPLPVRVFMFWLVMILWKRESDSAAAAGAG